MELIVITIFFIINTFLVLIINYYRRLFTADKATFTRDEITDLKEIIASSWNTLIAKESLSSYGGLSIGIVTGLLFSYMGGAYGRHYESYFFHSAAIPLLWFIGLPYIKENVLMNMEDNFFTRLVKKDSTFFFGLTIATVSSAYAAYGMYHAISFLWVITNAIGVLFLLLYRMYKDEQEISLIRQDNSADFTEETDERSTDFGDGENPPNDNDGVS